MSSLRQNLVGSWELIEYSGHLPSNESDKKYPLGQDARGLIMYTSDGYMSAQLMAAPQSLPGKEQSPKSQLYETGYIAYTGQYYVDEEGDMKGPILLHHMRLAGNPALLGDTQRRLVQILREGDHEYLLLGPDGTMKIDGEDRVIRVKWKRLPENHARTAPHGDKL